MREVIARLAPQLDLLEICANEFGSLEGVADLPENVRLVLPPSDLKDVGKFMFSVATDDYVLLVDDDIWYPPDYVKTMVTLLERFGDVPSVIGVHGTIFSDFYDGSMEARLVYSFRRKLSSSRVVNQLGTGTVACRGSCLPTLSYMASSSRFVDVRFAKYCFEAGIRQVCVAREDGWLSPMETEETLFNTFTQHWPIGVIQEINSYAGFRRLPSLVASPRAD